MMYHLYMETLFTNAYHASMKRANTAHVKPLPQMPNQLRIVIQCHSITILTSYYLGSNFKWIMALCVVQIL